jgi:hypothetical protein
MDFNQNLAWARDRIGHLRKPDIVRYRAVAVENKCAHRPILRNCGMNWERTGPFGKNLFKAQGLPALDLNTF